MQGFACRMNLTASKLWPAKQWDENCRNDWREGLAYPFAKQMDTKSSLPLIVRRRALPAVKRTIKAQIAIFGARCSRLFSLPWNPPPNHQPTNSNSNSKLRPCNFELVGCGEARLALFASDVPSAAKRALMYISWNISFSPFFG